MFGFALGYRGPVTAARPRNLLSARSRRSAVTVAVALEVSRGHTAGPFVRPPFRLFHCSPLGAAVKPDGSVRLILDLSSPRGASVNSGISREEFAVRYTSVDAAVDIVRRLGKDAFMAKADIRHAFRLCPVRPADWPLLCYQWAGRVYVDLRLPFGARSSPFIFTQFAEALHWIAVHVRGCLHVLHYLDDYFLARASEAACARDLDAFQDLCRDLGVPLAPEKLVLPTRCLQFLGITLDSSLQEMRLPPEKLARLRACLPAWRTRQKCTKRELLSLIGVLSFACKVVRPGRIFLRRLIDLSMTVPALAHHISLTAAARADIAWWVEFLPSWNGRAFFPPPPVAAAALGFATDASGVGLGAVYGQQWLYAAWPPAFRAYHINVLELFAVAVAVHCWGGEWHDAQILLHTDNMPVVQVWATGTCKCPHIMSLVRRLFFFLAQRNVNLRLAHVPGCQNINADMLSRLQVEEFRSRACGPLPMPTMVPSHVWEWL